MKTVLVLIPMDEAGRARLESAAPGCRFVYRKRGEETGEDVRGASVILGGVDPKRIGASETLELLQISAAGTDAFLRPGVLGPKTVLCNATGAYSKPVAEHALAMTLMLLKNLHLYRDNQKEARWKYRGRERALAECTVAVIGLGDIGKYYARLAKAMGARVIGVKRRPSPCPEYVDRLVLTGQTDEILPEADVVFTVLPQFRETIRFFDRERFEKMKPDAIFINCGRGSAVDEQALYEALSGGRLAAAAIDVTETEPLPPDSPLWSLENLVITPHVAGTSLKSLRESITDLAVRNLAAWAAGEPPVNAVDMTTGYRK